MILKSINLFLLLSGADSSFLAVTFTLPVCFSSSSPLYYPPLPLITSSSFLFCKALSKSKPHSTSASLTATFTHPFNALLSSLFIYFITPLMQLYGGLKVNMLQYMFVYNTPCLGQQVKGHNASDATQIMGCCG